MSSPTQPDEPHTPSWKVWLVIAWLLSFGFAFFRLDLPNSGSPAVNRTDVWLELPDLLLYSVVKHPDATDSGWSFFPQRLPIIIVGTWILAGVWGFGHLLARALRLRDLLRPIELAVFAFGLGMSGISLLVLGSGLLAQRAPDAMSREYLGLMLAGFASAECLLRAIFRVSRSSHTPGDEDSDASDDSTSRKQRRKSSAKQQASIGEILLRGQIPFGVMARSLAGTAMVLFVLAMALGAMLPSIDFDVKEYHLQGPKEWFLAGAISMLPHNVYTSFPFLTEMFHLLGMVLSGEWYLGALAGKFVIMMFAPFSGLAVFAAADRLFDRRAAWAAALIYLSTPWTYRISVIAYAEGGITFFLIATTLAILINHQLRRADSSSDEETKGVGGRRTAVLAGLLAGSSMACKYPGVLSVVIPAGSVLLLIEFRSGKAETLIRRVFLTGTIFTLGCTMTIGPWLLKNLYETGNPVYPLLNSVFHGIDWTPTLEANWKAAHGPPHHQPFDLLVKLFDVTLKSDWLSPLLFGLAPLVFLTPWSRLTSTRQVVIALWLYVAFLFLSWWVLTHRIDRFWIPLIPVVSILAGAGAWWTTAKTWRYVAGVFVAFCVLFNLGFITTSNCGLNTWLGDLQEVRDQSEFTAEPIARLNRMSLPSHAKVLCVGEAQVFDAQFPLIYNTVFDISIFEQWCSANEPGVPVAEQKLKPAEEIRQKLQAEGITHILVNWQEILRYRMTYGMSEFLAPWRLRQLQRDRVLLPQTMIVGGSRSMESFQDHERADILQWAPELITGHGDQQSFITAELYVVTPTAD